ncbi:MAG: LysM peptidoglycan-binding domain-containing protein [Anaerolineales bacterium]|nr:MAG: LysM peptidoglycan-binding domain-containing protein [Anaerolineales bacterium]
MGPLRVRWEAVLIVGCTLLILLGSMSAHAAYEPSVRLQPTSFPTPTPGQDGRITYQVQEGDSLWVIAAIAGISLEELMALNGIQPGDFISPGMELELGRAGPAAQPTAAQPDAQASPSGPTLTPTPIVGTAEICVLLFQDVNGDGRLEETELALEGGQVSVVDIHGVVAGEYTTEALLDQEELIGYCFTNLETGDYNVSAAVPPAYNATTSLNAPVSIHPGDIKYLQFGAQPSSALLGNDGAGGGGRSGLLGLIGLLLLVAAGGLGFYASRLSKNQPRSLR